MNQVFYPYLQKCILVFFDYVLIYNKTWEHHFSQLDQTLQLLHENQLYIKCSKCSFGWQELEYLGYIISKEGVKVDPLKIEAMQTWPLPKSLRSLQGFLKLIGYYCKFVKDYVNIVAPTFIKKNAFNRLPCSLFHYWP